MQQASVSTRIGIGHLRAMACRLALPVAIAMAGITAMPVAAQDAVTREQSLEALGHAEPARRLQGMLRLADVGTAADADAVMPLLRDDDPVLRPIAVALVWRLWGRSGDSAVDALYEKGLTLMQAGDLPGAVRQFSDIIALRPAFAEAWNKRATLYFMLDQYDRSMKDCDEVLKRVPWHFGALSGYAQMLAARRQPERALEMLERAFKVNPNMPDAVMAIENLRRQVEIRRQKSV